MPDAQSPEDTPTPPAGLAAVRAAAAGSPSSGAASNALAYFMGEEPPPGTSDVLDLDVEFVAGAKSRMRFRTLGIEELDKCAQEAAEAMRKGELAELGGAFVRWSYVCAFACIDPDLGQVLQARRQREQDPETQKQLTDTAALVRLVFRKRGGVLQRIAFEIERNAKLGDDGDGSVSVVEVEAGKA